MQRRQEKSAVLNLIVAGALFLALSARAGTVDPRCLNPLRALNVNAVRSMGEYLQTNGRTLHEYQVTFREKPHNVLSRFDKHEAALKKGDVALDLGSGLGIAMFQLAALQPDIVAVAVNSQDVTPFYARVLMLPDLIAERGEAALTIVRTPPKSERISENAVLKHRGRASLMMVAGIGTDNLIELCRGLGEPFPAWLKNGLPHDYIYEPEIIRSDLLRLKKKLLERLKSGRFRLKTAMAEDALDTYDGTVAMITDVYGAFFYGAERLTLVEKAYRALKPGGKAFFFLGEDFQYGGDVVTLKDGSTTALPSYLVSKYPQIFQLVPNARGRSLVMTKSATTGPALQIPLKVTKTDYYENRPTGYVVPKLFLQE